MPEFTTNWYSEENLSKLAELASATWGLPGVVIEVGCWEGRSSIAIANAVWPELLICIDTWEGSIPDGYTAQDDVHQRFINNMCEMTAGNFVDAYMSWEEFEWGEVSSIKFIHIDAEHTYEAVKGNIEVVLPKMASGGIICGDDFFHAPVKQAVRDCLPGAVAHSAALWSWRAP